MKTVSIAMATYNGARFIGEQLESFARQTVLPIELIVTDDRSTDGTLDIVAAFAARSPFPVYFESNAERLGYGGNFMKAAGLCRSELIAFADQDDVWAPNKLEACVTAFNEKDVLLAYHNATVVTETLNPIASLGSNAPSQTINPPLSLEPWKVRYGFTMIMDRFLLGFSELWLQSADFYIRGENEKHDQWHFFLASCLGNIAYISKPLVLYRQHGNNAEGYKTPTTLRNKFDLLFGNDMEGLKSREEAANRRANILELLRHKVDDVYSARAAVAADGYRKLEAGYRARLDMYASGNILDRVRRILALWRSGGYLPRNQWGVGRPAFLRDIVRGIFFPLTAPRDEARAEKANSLNV